MSNAQLQFRIKMERLIAEKIVRDAILAGYFVSVDNGDEPGESFTVDPTRDVHKVLNNMFQTDQEHVFFSKDSGQKKKFNNWVFLVYGNDGFDVLSDYTANEETQSIVKSAMALSEKLQDGAFKIVVK